MPFSHYAKIKFILNAVNSEWQIRRIDEPTTAKTFKGETRNFDHYYRIYDSLGVAIPYCKFQQIELFAKVMNINVEDIIIHDEQI